MPASSEKQHTKDGRPQEQAQIPESTVPPATSVNVKLPQVRVPFLTKFILQTEAPSNSSASSNDAVDRLLALVVKQSETIEEQGKRIKELEDQIARYLATMNVLEEKVDNLVHAQSKPKVLEDDDGAYVEI